MPGRTYNLNSYRFNYQGQEGAPGTNWQAFDLRMLNSDLGRWFAPDPYGQFHSPYVSMGNNPVSGVDPDGGWSFNNVPSTAPSWMWGMLAEMHSYRHSSFFYEGEYRKGIEIEAMMQQEYFAYQVDHYNQIFGAQDNPSLMGGIKYNSFGRSAPGGNIEMLKLMGFDPDRSYEALENDKILTLASLGGYTSKNGSVYKVDGENLSIEEDRYMNMYQPNTGDATGDISRADALLLNTSAGGWEGHFNYISTKVVGNISSNTSKFQTAGYEPNRHWIGPTLIGLGSELIDKPFSLGKKASKGTSVASSVLRKALPQTSPVVKNITTRLLGRGSSTAVLGGALGRFVPIVGWGLTANDLGQTIWQGNIDNVNFFEENNIDWTYYGGGGF